MKREKTMRKKKQRRKSSGNVVTKIAARILGTEKYTHGEVMAIAASVVSQYELKEKK